MKNKVLGIDWALTVQFELKCSLERKHNEKKQGIFLSSVISSTNETRYL